MESLPARSVNVWVTQLRFIGAQEEGGVYRVRLEAPHDFTRCWIRDYFQKDIEAAFHQVKGLPTRITLDVAPVAGASGGTDGPQPGARELPLEADRGGAAVASDAFSHPSEPTSGSSAPVGALPGVVISESELRNRTAPSSPPRATGGSSGGGGNFYSSGSGPTDNRPDPRFTFDNFVVGASNQFAHASAVSVSEQPQGHQYNPLFIHSPPGLGKTHLLHAIGNQILKQKSPQTRVAYLSAERFVNELIDSLQHRRMPQFRAKFRDSFDVILIDDIQFIAGKNSSEEEFFHTFNALRDSGRQIVVTSDRHPKEIDGLEERIRTRFEWGLVSDIKAPEIETRIAILKGKAERDDIYLPDEVATFLATYVKSNVRELEGLLIKLQAQSSLAGGEISLDMAKSVLRNAVPEEGVHFTTEMIQTAVCKHFQVRLVDLKGAGRSAAIALPRQVAMYLLRKYTSLSFAEIGAHFGGRDHSTVIYACERVTAALEAPGEPVAGGRPGLRTGKTDAIHEAVEAIQNLL